MIRCVVLFAMILGTMEFMDAVAAAEKSSAQVPLVPTG